MPKRRRPLVLAALCLAAGLAVTGCGSSETSSALTTSYIEDIPEDDPELIRYRQAHSEGTESESGTTERAAAADTAQQEGTTAETAQSSAAASLGESTEEKTGETAAAQADTAATGTSTAVQQESSTAASSGTSESRSTQRTEEAGTAESASTASTAGTSHETGTGTETEAQAAAGASTEETAADAGSSSGSSQSQETQTAEDPNKGVVVGTIGEGSTPSEISVYTDEDELLFQFNTSTDVSECSGIAVGKRVSVTYETDENGLLVATKVADA